MSGLHTYFCRKSLRYHRWHKHPYHPHAHWGVASFVSLVFGVLITILGFTGWDLENPGSSVHAQTTITINGGQRYQTMTGFGAYFPGPSWYVDRASVNSSINQALDDLVADLGVTIARFMMPSGSEDPNDNASPTSLDLTKFNPGRTIIRDGQCQGGTNAGAKCRLNSQCGGGTCVMDPNAHDHEYNIDTSILAGLKARGIGQFFLEPMSPPPWNKTTGLLSGRSEGGSVVSAPEFGEWIAGTILALRQSPYSVNVNYVGILNEPKYCVETCANDTELLELIQAVKQQFTINNVAGVQIMASSEGRPWDAHNQLWLEDARSVGLDIFSHHEYCSTGHEEGECASGLDRIGLQGQAVGVPVWQSENGTNAASGVALGDSFDEGLELGEAIHEDLTRAGSVAWLFYSALETGDSARPVPAGQTPNHAADYRLVYYDAGTVWKSPKYFAMKMYAKAIPPGSARIGVSGAPTDVKVTAYTHTNGTVTVVALNKTSSQQSVRLSANGVNAGSLRQYRYSAPCEYGNQAGCFTSQLSVTLGQTIALPPRSITTFTTVDMGTFNPPAQRCGDGACNGTEDAVSCPADCVTGIPTTNRAPNKPTLVYCPGGLCGGNSTQCGNGTVESGEQCDGSSLGGQTCQTQGFQSGTLTCASNCAFNTSQCVSAPMCTPSLACTTAQGCSGVCNALGTACNDSNPNDGCPVIGDLGDYPLIGWITFDGAVADWYARFDLLKSRLRGASEANAIHAINPNTKLLFMQDFNVGCGLSVDPNWVLKKSDGSVLDSGYGPMMNLSKFGIASGYNQACATNMGNLDFNLYYGISTDGLWGKEQVEWFSRNDSEWMTDPATGAGVDINRDGINDHNQIGSIWSSWGAWGNDWQAGVDDLLTRMRNELSAKVPGRTVPITLNVGSPFSWGRQWINGHTVEHYWGDVRNSTSHGVRDPYAIAFQENALSPYVSMASGMPDLDDPESQSNPLGETRDHLKWMRFGLVTSMFDDYYFSNQDANYNPRAVDADGNWYQQEHYWSFWYDEFEVELGRPIDTARELRPGLGFRCFENGIALANVDGTDKTVSASELNGLCSGHSGTYYKVKSGQDLALATLGTWTPLHNGGQFTSATLTSVRYGPLDNYRGDGLILTLTPQTLVSDIIVDNNYMSTSPTVRIQPDGYPVILSGMVQEQGCRLSQDTPPTGSDYYTVRCGWNNKSDAYAIQSSGSPRAEFVPTIGVPGQYEVFEWHGRSLTGAMASAATLTVNHTGGSTSLPLNQQVNQGKWTSFGTYQFNAGTSGSVVLTNSGTGQLMADAIKFVYRGSGTALGESTQRSSNAILPTITLISALGFLGILLFTVRSRRV